MAKKDVADAPRGRLEFDPVRSAELVAMECRGDIEGLGALRYSPQDTGCPNMDLYRLLNEALRSSNPSRSAKATLTGGRFEEELSLTVLVKGGGGGGG